MTLITFQDGKAVMREGQVGTEQECCCGCECPEGCIEGLYISVGGAPGCSSTESGIVYEDLAVLPNPCNPEFVLLASVAMRCEDGKWTAQLFLCGLGCFQSYTADLEAGPDCLPVAGTVTGWTLVGNVEDDCCGDVLPTVTILR